MSITAFSDAKTITMQLALPRDIVGVLDVPEAWMPQKTLELIALELYRQGRISAGKAAELAGMRKVDFIELLSRMGIDYLDQSHDELAADVAAVEELLRQGTQ